MVQVMIYSMESLETGDLMSIHSLYGDGFKYVVWRFFNGQYLLATENVEMNNPDATAIGKQLESGKSGKVTLHTGTEVWVIGFDSDDEIHAEELTLYCNGHINLFLEDCTIRIHEKSMEVKGKAVIAASVDFPEISEFSSEGALTIKSDRTTQDDKEGLINHHYKKCHGTYTYNKKDNYLLVAMVLS